MKVTLHEHEGCFEFAMEPERVKEAALLVRFALNCTKEARDKLLPRLPVMGKGAVDKAIDAARREKP